MMMRWNWVSVCLVALACAGLMVSTGCRRKKYENPISKDTRQPDKVLYDKSINDIEKGRYEVARLTLNTLINTYDTSEFLAKAKLAIADSWFREGGSSGLAQAEAEYKDFILFYPTMEEAAESQQKICMIHYRQMDKPDRDETHIMRAEEECRQLLVQFPNSKFVPQTMQLMRNIQEVIGEKEFRVGDYYYKKGNVNAAANRLQTLTDQYPLYSRADEALFALGDSYSKMGPRFRDKSGKAFARVVKDYPLSLLADQAKDRLKTMEIDIPEADPQAVARMKYELENREKPGMMSPVTSILKRGPDTKTAAKSGQPVMTPMRPGTPASVPIPAAESATGVTDVGAEVVNSNNSALDTQPDARQNVPGTTTPPEAATTAAPATAPAAATQATTPAATNNNKKNKKEKKPKDKDKDKK
jgi:outer membrane protein assembly factor BamD